MLRGLVAVLLACLGAINVCSAQTTSSTSYNFAGCTDAANKAVTAKADPALDKLVQARQEDGHPVIYYNPSALPQLLPETRAFVFAHECGRVHLGQPLAAERTLEQAQRADCWALGTLRRSHIATSASSIEAIQLDLPEDAELWAQLPGPARSLQLASCAKGGGRHGNLDLPEADAPHSQKWDACIQSCGARLYSCGRAAACQQAYDACSKACSRK